MNFEKGKIIAIVNDSENEKKRSKKKDNKFLGGSYYEGEKYDREV